MITAIGIDDEPLALEILEGYCKKMDFIRLEKTFTQTAEGKIYLKKYPVDLIFLDINMPSISGIDLYKGLDQDTMVIFTRRMLNMHSMVLSLARWTFCLSLTHLNALLRRPGRQRSFIILYIIKRQRRNTSSYDRIIVW